MYVQAYVDLPVPPTALARRVIHLLFLANTPGLVLPLVHRIHFHFRFYQWDFDFIGISNLFVSPQLLL